MTARESPAGYSLVDPSDNSTDDVPVYPNDNGYLSPGAHLRRLASREEKKRLWWRNALINILFIAAWYVCIHLNYHLLKHSRFLFATILSVYNKWMFAEKYMHFPAPLFVTTLHMFVQFALAAIVRAIWPRRFRPDRTPSLPDYG